MKIACLTGQFPRWSEQFLQRDLVGLTTRGHTLSIWPCEEATHSGNARWMQPNGNRYPPVLQRAALPLRSLSCTLLKLGWLQLRRLPQAARAFSLLPHTPDCIWSLFGTLPAAIGYTLANALNIPFVVSLHARDVWVPWEPGLAACRHADHILVCNRAAQQELLRRWPDRTERIHLVHHALPPEVFCTTAEVQPNSTLADPLSENVILAAGRFVPKKGFDCLIQAMPAVLAACPDASLLLVGEGSDDHIYRALRQELRLSPEQIRIQERVPSATLYRLIRRAAVVAVPSRVAPNGDRDGIPNILLEAMALGTPVVATDAGSIDEVVIEGETGRLCPPNDPGTLADALLASLSRAKETQAMANRAATFVADHFSQKQCIDILDCIFQEMQSNA